MESSRVARSTLYSCNWGEVAGPSCQDRGRCLPGGNDKANYHSPPRTTLETLKNAQIPTSQFRDSSCYPRAGKSARGSYASWRRRQKPSSVRRVWSIRALSASQMPDILPRAHGIQNFSDARSVQTIRLARACVRLSPRGAGR